MIASLLRYTLVLSLAFGVLAPKMGAVLVQLIPGWQTMVICTGGEMVVLTISPDGEPVEVAQDGAEPCPFAAVVAGALQAVPGWVSLAPDYDHRTLASPNLRSGPGVALIRGPTRAPPAVV